MALLRHSASQWNCWSNTSVCTPEQFGDSANSTSSGSPTDPESP